MRSLKWICTIFIVLATLFTSHNTFSQDQNKEEPWTGTLEDGTKIDAENLKRIITDHKKWVSTDGKEGKKADLREAKLQGADLYGAGLKGANLQKAELGEADLRGAIMFRADLRKAELKMSNLQGAIMHGADLRGAKLKMANLERANLREAKLQGADLEGAKLWGVIFEPVPGNLPQIQSIALAKGLETLTYRDSPIALIELKEAFKKSGFRNQERQINYSIEHTTRLKTLSWRNIFASLKALLELVFFDYTCKWGLAPLRPLMYLILCIILGIFPYTLAIRRNSPTSAIWKVWDRERIVKDLGQDKPERITKRGFKSFSWGIYFSFLSSTSLGWRNLTIGKWFIRIQPREYVLKPTGWVRSVSGIQSLIGVYLIFLVIFIYFGQLLDGLRSV